MTKQETARRVASRVATQLFPSWCSCCFSTLSSNCYGSRGNPFGNPLHVPVTRKYPWHPLVVHDQVQLAVVSTWPSPKAETLLEASRVLRGH